MRNILITGATGFLGSNLAAALTSQGYNVRIMRRPTSDLRALQGIDVEHRLGDLRDKESLRKAMHGCDTVFHAAALVSYWRKQRPEVFEINIGGTANIVDTCLDLGIEKLVHTSSVAAVGFAGDRIPADETTAFNWESYDIGYRTSKHRGELEVLRGVRLGLQAVIVNPSVIVGERDIHFNGGQIVRDVYKKRLFYAIDGGISVVYVGDVVQGQIAAASKGRIGERYILSGENLTHEQILGITAEVVGGWKPILTLPLWAAKSLAARSEAFANLTNSKPWLARELVAGITRTCWFSCEKASRELGYSVTPFRTAVQKTFDWYKSNLMI